jgi:hypothetical protein
VKRTFAALVAVVGAFFAANMLSVAVAEAPTATPLRTISVEGIATLPIGQFADGPTATAVYREGTAAAITDGQGKASFLASKVGGTATAVQSVVEGGGYINCSSSEESYVEYGGVEPDFGTASAPSLATPTESAAPVPAKEGSSSRPVRRLKPKQPKKKRKAPVAKKASVVSCTLTAQVSLVYALG